MPSAESTLRAGNLELTFYRQGDRYGHSWAIVDADGARVLLESIEGTPADPWPPSPALQEFHIERRGDGRKVAMLVGMAGTSHWSVATEPLTDGEPGFLVDVACRIHAASGSLGSSYLVRTPVIFSGFNALLKFDADQHTQLLFQAELAYDSVPLRLEIVGGRCVARAEADGATFPATMRWKYSVRLADSDLDLPRDLGKNGVFP